MIKTFSAILLISLFNQSALATTFELNQIQVNQQPAFTDEQVQQKLTDLAKAYGTADAKTKGPYFYALEKAGVDQAELIAENETATAKSKGSFILNCIRALLGLNTNQSTYADLREGQQLDQFTEFVLSKGLKARINLSEAIDRATHHVVFGSHGLHNRRFIGTVHLLVLPSTLRYYEGDEVKKAEELVDAVSLHLARFPESPQVKLAASKNAFITVNKVPGQAYNPLGTYDVTVHTPCGYTKVTSLKLETTVIYIIDAMAKLNANASALHSSCR